MDESRCSLHERRGALSSGPRERNPPRLGKGILAAPYNPAAPGAAPRFRPPVLSLFRSKSA